LSNRTHSGWFRRLLGCRRGAAAVEFALMTPIVTAAMVGVTDMGLAANEKMRLTNAARAGAQYALSNPTDTNGTQSAVQSAAPGMSSVSVSLSKTCGCADGSSLTCGNTCNSGITRTYITVTASTTHTFLVSYPAFGSSIALSSSASIRIQ
jgi:Flp pilus assembly protein TadG